MLSIKQANIGLDVRHKNVCTKRTLQMLLCFSISPQHTPQVAVCFMKSHSHHNDYNRWSSFLTCWQIVKKHSCINNVDTVF